MKKYLLLASVAALAFTSCSDQSTEFVGDSAAQKAREIAFAPVAKPTTRAAVDGTTFPTTSAMQVAAWDVTNNRNFFTHTPFTYSGSGTIWKGDKYWPLSEAYINFLAYTNFQGTAGSETDGATWASDEASQVTLVMTDNKTAQKDLMYARGGDGVTQTSNALTFPTDVAMVFKHAQAWITFTATASDAATSNKITLNYITLNGASYSGTFTVTQGNYNSNTGQTLSGAWTASTLGAKGTDVNTDPTNVAANVVTPYTQTVPEWNGWDNDSDSGTPNVKTIPTGTVLPIGVGLMIVPDDDSTTADFVSFTVNYTLDGNTYDYTFTPTTKNVNKAEHYIYNIVFTLHEIEISASVTDWVDKTGVNGPIF